jgi:hypothetical protein
MYTIVTIMNYIRFYIFFVESKSICSRVYFCYTDKFCKNSVPFGNHPRDEFKRKNQDLNVPLLIFIVFKNKLDVNGNFFYIFVIFFIDGIVLRKKKKKSGVVVIRVSV